LIAKIAPPGLVVVDMHGELNGEVVNPREEACIQNAAEKRRRQFRSGRACARAALARLDIENFTLLPNEDGSPCWPPGVVGSITHTAGYCAAAVARRHDFDSVGIDAEASGALGDALARMVCSPTELERLSNLNGESAGRWAKLVFSAKESVFKYYYPLARTRLDFADLDIEITPQLSRFEARLLNKDRPAAAGARAFEGRFAWNSEHVFTIVTQARNVP